MIALPRLRKKIINMWEKELEDAIQAAMLAWPKIMEIYGQNFDVEIKADNSPVTLADKTADKIIREYLKQHYPTYAFLTEESDDDLSRLENDLVWIVDPVDGTKDFVAKDDEFTTNIALAYKHEVVVGVITAPAKNEIYFASKGNGAFSIKNGVKKQIHVNDKIENITCLKSVFHTTPEEVVMFEKHKDKIAVVEKAGSALKACRIAEGVAELSYRLSPGTKEWDTAASQILILEAGGIFQEPDGNEIKYNRVDVYNRKGYIICNRKENILL